jgi:hypothetical protein
MFNKCAF